MVEDGAILMCNDPAFKRTWYGTDAYETEVVIVDGQEAGAGRELSDVDDLNAQLEDLKAQLDVLEAEETIKKFDANGNGVLDPDEL